MDDELTIKFKKAEAKYKALKKARAAKTKAEKAKAAEELLKTVQRKNELLLEFVLSELAREGVELSSLTLQSGAVFSNWLKDSDDRKLFNLEGVNHV